MKFNNYSIWIFCVSIAVLGCKDELKVSGMTVESSVQIPVNAYHRTISSPNYIDSNYEDVVGVEHVRDCIINYCEAIHDEKRYGGLSTEFLSARNALCAADLFSRYASSMDSITFGYNGSPLVADENLSKFENYELNPIFYCNLGSGVGRDSQTTISYTALTEYEQRREMKALAFRQYYNAMNSIQSIAAETSGVRDELYDELKDDFDYQATGSELIVELFASLPSVVKKMQELKIGDAEDSLLEGAHKGDEWRSTEYGRKRAFLDLWGNYYCDSSTVAAGDGFCWDYVGGTVTQPEGGADHEYVQNATDACPAGSKLPSLQQVKSMLGGCKVVQLNSTGDTDDTSNGNFKYDCIPCAESEMCKKIYGAGPTYDGATVAGDQFQYYKFNPSSDFELASGGYYDLNTGDIYHYFLESTTNIKLTCVASADTQAVPQFFPDVATDLSSDSEKSDESRAISMSNELHRAIGLISRNNGNYLAAGASANAHSSMSDPAVMGVLDAVRERENEQREKGGLDTFDTVEELAASNGTTKAKMLDALQYMYVHHKIFPREIEMEMSGASIVGSEDLTSWASEPAGRSTAWLLSDWRNEPIDSFTDVISDYIVSIGIVPGMLKIRQMIADSAETFEAQISDSSAYYEADEAIVAALKNTVRATDSILGREWLEVTVADDGNMVVLYNSTQESVGGLQFAVYPEDDWFEFDIADLDAQKLAEQNIAKNTLCMHDFPDGSNDCSHIFRSTSEPLEYDDEVDDNGDPLSLPLSVKAKHSFSDAELMAKNSSNINTNWVIALRHVEDASVESDTTPWTTAGVVDMRVRLGEGKSTNMFFVLEGVVKDMTTRIASVDSKNISNSRCAPIAGLLEECIDPYWVPAIDNEVVDGSGNQYEQSYRHYLANATTAAEKAKALREEIISDVITVQHDSNAKAAQFDRALDYYMAGVSEICGDNVDSGFSQQAEQLYSSSSKNFEASLASYLEQSYGCLNNVGDQKRNPIHCAEQRRCEGVSLAELGLEIPSSNSYDRGEWGDFIDAYSESEDVFFDGEGSWEGSVDGLDYASVLRSFYKQINWINDYRTVIGGILEGTKVEDVPGAIVLTAAQLSDDGEVLGFDPDGSALSEYGQGLYYQKLRDIAAEVETLKSLVESYIGELDHAEAITKATQTQIHAGLSSAQLSTAAQLMNATQQSAIATAQLSAELMRTIENIEADQYGVGGPKSEGQFLRAIEFISSHFSDYKEKGPLFLAELSTDHFIDVCVDILETKPGAPVVFHSMAPQVCLTLQEIVFPKSIMANELLWTRSLGKVYVVPFDAFRDANWQYTRDFFDMTHIRIKCGASDGTGSGSKVNDWWLHMGTQDEDVPDGIDVNFGSKKSGKSKSDICNPNKSWYDINFLKYSSVAYWLWDSMKKKEIEQATSSSEGCDWTSDGPDNCIGQMQEVYGESVDSWKSGSLRDLSMNAAFLQADAQADSLEAQIVSVNNNLLQTKYRMAQSLEAVAMKIAQLSDLEEKQVTLFDSFINDVNSANAAGYSSVAEWQERFDFRVEQYQKQLRRARIAAWVARRAIEFRFGVDLSEETTSTIYGDTPSEWADDIYGAYVSQCGYAQDSSLSNENTSALGTCLAPEERVEEYVQKLSDYVDSYGNNPNDNWWFHEDDDTAVISLRDHTAVGDMVCNGFNANMLFFTEEMDMSQTIMESDYAEVLAADSGLTQYPSPWVANNVSVEADDASFGLPDAVASAHNTSEADVFIDQVETWTVDHLIAMPGNSARLTQTIYNSEVQEEFGDFDDLEFSAWVRKPTDIKGNQDCAIGEMYFPEIGKCGFPCETDADCAVDEICMTEIIGAGIGVATGLSLDTDADEIVNGMCNACQDDGACIGQDATAMEMEIHDQSHAVIAKRNVSVYPYWTQGKVNTVEHLSTYSNAGSDMMSVSFVNLETQNLLVASENFENSAGDSASWQTDGTIDFVSTSMAAPNTSETATSVKFSSGSRLVTSASVPYHTRGVTGSLWMRAPNALDAGISVDLSLESPDSSVINNRRESVLVSPEWRRYSVELGRPAGHAGPYYGSLAIFSIVPDVDSDTVIELWGAQVEEGMGMTPYLPTFSDYVEQSNDFTSWVNTYPVDGQILDCELDGGVLYPSDNGVCWYKGGVGDDCNTTCVAHGGYNDKTKTIAGSGGTDEACMDLALAFGATMHPDMVGVVEHVTWHPGAGCYVQEDVPVYWVIRDLTETTAEATGNSTQHARICACGEGSTNATAQTGVVLSSELGVDGSTYAYEISEYDSDSTAYIVDDVSISEAGQYTYSVWLKRDASNVGTNQPAIELEAPSGEEAISNCTVADTEWTQCSVSVTASASGLLVLRLYPANNGDEDTGSILAWMARVEKGAVASSAGPVDWGLDVGVTGAQLVSISGGYCDKYGDYASAEDNGGYAYACASTSVPYVRNTYLREHMETACSILNPPGLYTFDELSAELSDSDRIRVLKSEFDDVRDSEGNVEYYKYTFNVDMDAVESGSMGQFGVLAPGNFNYRIGTVGVNVVGTDVLNCDQANSPATCAANQWLSYDLKQMGEVYIRNHHDEYNVKPFDIPTGMIKGAKAWVAEQVIGFPVSGAHQSAMSQMNKISLMGRPLQGTFELRIYNTPELVWRNVEDVQLLLGYHYWTKSE